MRFIRRVGNRSKEHKLWYLGGEERG